MLRERVAENVYVFTSEAYAQVNAGAVIGPEWTVLIDTLALPEETLEIKEFVEKRLGRPVRYVVNTHHHSDHTLGNALFPKALVVSHTLCRSLLDTRGREALEQAREHSRELQDVQLHLPELTFSHGELVLRAGRRTMRLIPLPGHSQDGIGVLVDWVPAHFPRDGHGLRRFDGTALYEHSDPRQGEHRDWGTHIFNYGRHEVRNFLISNALFWFDKYHIDGVRVDAVASMLYLDYSRHEGDWIPNEYGGRENLAAITFLKQLNEQVHLQFPGVLTVAEESTAWPGVSKPTYLGGLGFSLKWNMGWMNDTTGYMRHEPVHRKYHHDQLTFSLIYAFHENFVLPLSHDEVVHCKGSLLDQMPGDLWQKFANLRLLFSYMWTHPGKKLLFMGSDFGQWNEWDFDTSLQWDLLQWDSHRGLKKCVADLNRLYRREKALHEVDFDGRGFQWIDCHNYDNSTLSSIRYANDPNDFLVVCSNFTPVPRTEHRLGVPKCCWYEELFSSDSMHYGGSNLGNGPGVMAQAISSHGRPASIKVCLPPLATVVFKPRG